MLVESSMVMQRYQAVREVIDSGDPITEVAVRYGAGRRTLHRWVPRQTNTRLLSVDGYGVADLASTWDRPPQPSQVALTHSVRGLDPHRSSKHFHDFILWSALRGGERISMDVV